MDSNTQKLPNQGYFCISQILGNPQAKPNPIPPIFPISKSNWYAGIAKGVFPRPVLRGRYSIWRAADIRRLFEEIETRAKGEGSDGRP